MDAASYYLGLDLGRMEDPSCLAVVRKDLRWPPGKVPDPEINRQIGYYTLSYLKRWPLATSYNTIIREVVRTSRRPPLPGSPLAVDATGPGLPVVDRLREENMECRLIPVTITGGQVSRPHRKKGMGWTVPKRDLASVMLALFAEDRFRVAQVEDKHDLLKELRTFSYKLSKETGSDTYEHLRTSDKDDMVLATALALWLAERRPRTFGLRTYPLQDPFSKKPLTRRLVACSAQELAALEVECRAPVLVLLLGPNRPPLQEYTDHLLPKTPRLLCLPCADLTPEEASATWTTPLPCGLLPEQAMLSKEQARSLWAFLLSKWEVPWDVCLFVDKGDGDRRALSMAMAVAGALRLPAQAVFCPASEDQALPTQAPNPHLFTLVREARHRVVS